LAHGANFSVPGSGKTTVTLALHLLTRKPGYHLLVIGPKAAFPAWREIVGECMDPGAPDHGADTFQVLEGSADQIERTLRGGGTRFVVNYELMVERSPVFSAYLARNKVHLVLDEAHRIKGGALSQRGALLLNLANLPVRRDILTGTPMPQGPEDLAALLGFLWPGHEYRVEIQRGKPPREVLGQLYVRTTKRELGLLTPKYKRYLVPMAPGQLALYGVIRNESLRQIAQAVGSGNAAIDFLRAKRSVMRLLQLSSNPVLALKAISGEIAGLKSGIVDQVLAEGPSTKMRAVADHARALAHSGEKVVIWTIFTETISELERMLADLNPVTLFGAVPTGEADSPDTREGRLRRFHVDKACQVMIANPAAAGEGISLHTVCHHAIYLDRSYVSTHYLQSVDRIHRLGLPPGVETYIHIYHTKAPVGLGSVDLSVNRRLALKIRNLQQLLDDPDLHQIALDEENADDPIDYDVELQDLVDLVEELEGKKGTADEESE
jgi:SNF2 family DNA or RNA helicase